MSKQSEDESRVSKLLNTTEGQWFMDWLKEQAGVDAPVFALEGTRKEPHVIKSAIREGGRQLWCRLSNIQKKDNE